MNQQNKQKNVALVTGGGRGIGKAISERLAREGHRVVVNYSGSEAAALETVQTIEAQGGEAIALQGDISLVNDIEKLFDAALEKFDRIDVLVNNAGVMLNNPIGAYKEEDFDRMFAINVKGTFFACWQAARKLSEGGSIINFSSSTTALIFPGYAAYCATKGAVEQITHVLSRELGAKGIRVNTLSPGPTETPLFLQGKSEADLARLSGMTAFGRLGQPQDIADVVALLVSEEARWITGQNIRVNGGLI